MKTNKLDTVGYLTPEEIVEFQKLCKDVKGITLSYEEAEDQATRLVMLLEALDNHKPKRG